MNALLLYLASWWALLKATARGEINPKLSRGTIKAMMGLDTTDVNKDNPSQKRKRKGHARNTG